MAMYRSSCLRTNLPSGSFSRPQIAAPVRTRYVNPGYLCRVPTTSTFEPLSRFSLRFYASNNPTTAATSKIKNQTLESLMAEADSELLDDKAPSKKPQDPEYLANLQTAAQLANQLNQEAGRVAASREPVRAMAKDTYDKQVQKEAEDQERYAQLRESLEKATVSPEVDAERKRKKKEERKERERRMREIRKQMIIKSREQKALKEQKKKERAEKRKVMLQEQEELMEEVEEEEEEEKTAILIREEEERMAASSEFGYRIDK